MSLSDIDKRQGHKDKCLQGNHQDMENRPCQSGKDVETKQNRIQHFNASRCRPSATQQSNQKEHQLAGIHVTEQPHTVRNCFRKEFDQIQKEVGGSKLGAERSAEQLMNPTTDTFDFDIVINTNHQDTDSQR